jgi:hypothetical protein
MLFRLHSITFLIRCKALRDPRLPALRAIYRDGGTFAADLTQPLTPSSEVFIPALALFLGSALAKAADIRGELDGEHQALGFPQTFDARTWSDALHYQGTLDTGTVLPTEIPAHNWIHTTPPSTSADLRVRPVGQGYTELRQAVRYIDNLQPGNTQRIGGWHHVPGYDGFQVEHQKKVHLAGYWFTEVLPSMHLGVAEVLEAENLCLLE